MREVEVVEEPQQEVVKNLPQVHLGTTIAIGGANYGTEAGQAILALGDISMPLAVAKWEEGQAAVTLPLIGLAGSKQATIHLFRANGEVANQVEVELLPAKAETAAAAANQATANQAATTQGAAN